MQKILITTGIFPPEIGGPASYGMLLGRELSGDTSVTLLTYSAKRSYADDKKLPFRVIRVWKGIPKPFRHLSFFFKVFFLVRQADKIFALNAVSAGVPALTAARILKKKFYVKIVGDYAWEIAVNSGKTHFLIDDFQNSKKTGRISLLHRLQSWVARSADAVIVPSQYLAGVVNGWGVPLDRIHVVYNGVDFEASSIEKEEARKNIGVPGSVILSVGRLVPWKGFRMLVKLMPELLKINQFFRLVIIGDGPDKKQLEAMIKNMSLERKVYLAGKKSPQELALYLAAADMFVLNTGYEGFSHQILEVMSAGVPVIATAVGGNREVIRQGENGFMVKYNDEFNLMEAIKEVWQSRELRDGFVAAGRETVRYFSHEKMLEETRRVLTLT